jgi:hypothetical protein
MMMNEIENLKQRLRVQLWGRQKGFIPHFHFELRLRTFGCCSASIFMRA